MAAEETIQLDHPAVSRLLAEYRKDAANIEKLRAQGHPRMAEALSAQRSVWLTPCSLSRVRRSQRF